MSPKPTQTDLLAAANKSIPDVIQPDLHILFCGINPGLYSAAIQHHFGRPGNRFWHTLHRAGFTPRQFTPYEERELLPLGYGITNVVERSSARADELSGEELLAGGERLRQRVIDYRPKVLAVLGITAYRGAFLQPKAQMGLQSETIGATKIWVLPNPSGLNAHHTLDSLAELFRQLNHFVNPSS